MKHYSLPIEYCKADLLHFNVYSTILTCTEALQNFIVADVFTVDFCSVYFSLDWPSCWL